MGKSSLAVQFVRTEYKSFILIDFANVSPYVRDVFEHDSYNLDLFFSKLSVYYSTELHERNSVFIFDEVQQYPRARQLVKYLVADGRCDYIETGSLIGLRMNVQDIVIPSGEEHVELFPLDFEEFLWALGDNVTVPLLRTCFEKRIPLGDAVHRKIMNDFSQYMLVGGMPQAVVAYNGNRNFEAAEEMKRNILRLYREDVVKFAKGYEDKVLAIFDNIPAQLSRKGKNYRLSSISRDARFRSYEESFLWLDEAMIVNTCFNSTDPRIGLGLNMDRTKRKCYMADTGLLVTHAFRDIPYVKNELYKAVLFDKVSINEGMIVENVTAQMLRTNGHRLFFYSNSDALHRENDIKIDFLISEGNRISPIEVKSGDYRGHASLDKFVLKYGRKLGTRYILHTKDLCIKDNIVHLPLYMAMFL